MKWFDKLISRDTPVNVVKPPEQTLVERYIEHTERTKAAMLERDDYDPRKGELHPEFIEHIKATGTMPLYNQYGPRVSVSLNCTGCSYYNFEKTTVENNRGTSKTHYTNRCEHPKGQGEIKAGSTELCKTPKWCPYAVDFINHEIKGYINYGSASAEL